MSIFSRLRGAAAVLSRNYTGFLASNRAYGSAALQLDYDFDDYEDDTESKIYGNRTMEDSEGSVSGRGVQWVIIGDPMANRHVYAERLSKLLQVPHISMGTLVRQELHPRSYLYTQIASSINQGKLVPEEVIFGLLSKRLEEGYSRGETGFILDGIPRTKIQAEILEQIVDIDLVLNLKCPECLLTKHIANHACSSCEGLVNIGSSKLSLNLHSKDNQTGLSSATDAKNSVLRETHRIYAEQRKPLEDYYRKQKKLLEFQVSGGPGETWQGLLAALHLQHMSGAVTSSQKLSA